METTGSAEGDKVALLALYHSSGGSQWTKRWDLNADVSTWHGVVLNSEGRVVELVLNTNNLRGKSPCAKFLS